MTRNNKTESKKTNEKSNSYMNLKIISKENSQINLKIPWSLTTQFVLILTAKERRDQPPEL